MALRRWLLLAALPLCIGVLAYGMTQPDSRLNPRSWFTTRPPHLVYPTLLEATEGEAGKSTVLPFQLANEGDEPLVIHSNRSSCACTGLERLESGGWTILRELKLLPHERLDLRCRVMGRTAVGLAQRHAVILGTNDPQRPEATLFIQVNRTLGGLTAVPSEALFGDVLVGEEASQKLLLVDSATPPRQVRAVRSGNPAVVATYHPFTEPRQAGGGWAVGELEVRFRAAVEGDFRGAISIDLDRDQARATELPVTAVGRGVLQVSPSQVLLPRHSAQGPVYQATILARSYQEPITKLTLRNLPAGWRAEPDGVGDPRARQVKLERSGESPSPAATFSARLVGELASGRVIEKEIRVACAITNR